MRRPKGLCAFCQSHGVENDAYTTVDYVPICDGHIARAEEGAEAAPVVEALSLLDPRSRPISLGSALAHWVILPAPKQMIMSPG